MQEGSRVKWAEIQANDREEDIHIFALTETHLKNKKMPYLDDEWKRRKE